MMLCSRCKKRPAVVLITAMQGNQKKNEGLCLVCAKELNIPQVDEYMKQMGISDEELDQISNQMMDLMDGENFEMGGSGVIPQFLENLMKDGPMKSLANLNEEDGAITEGETPSVPPVAPCKAEKGTEISEQLLHQPEPACRRGQAGCHYRAGQGNRTCDSDSVSPHQEQPLPDRRTRCW